MPAGWPACPPSAPPVPCRLNGAATGAGQGLLNRGDDTGLHDGDADRVAGLGRAAAEVDVVIDYLWGEPAVSAMVALVTGRADRGQLLSWIQIGSVAGPTAAIPSAALRAARLQIVGSGQGSVSTREILAELPALAQEITEGSFEIDARSTSLAEVEQAWADAGTNPAHRHHAPVFKRGRLA